MDNAARIAQFENMTQADPTNEMAHFSLGRAYTDAGRFADAARSYERCVELVPDMSKAYQLAGEMHIKAGEKDRAVRVLQQGLIVATGKGDLMPKNAMTAALRSLGEIIDDTPAADTSAPHSGPIPEGMIRCRRTGRVGNKLKRPPFRGPLGEWIAANITEETFKAWISQGTKVINELRLDLSREKDQDTYDQHMREYLGIDDAVLSELR